MKEYHRGMWLALLMCLAFCSTLSAAEDFYSGKTIRLIVATTPGGGWPRKCR